MKLRSLVLISLTLPMTMITNAGSLDPDDHQDWKLTPVEHPANNAPTPERVELGKMLFFDPRLSRDGNMSCATCHSPLFGWSDGLKTAKGAKSQVLGRATPTIVNSAYSEIHMWDGRKKDLEDQAMGPMEAAVEMNTNIDAMFDWLKKSPGYKAAFEQAYPGEPIEKSTVSRAIAAFERTVVSDNAPFDHWLAGDEAAMSESAKRGFEIFLDKDRGNCAVCHSAPHFTDHGFHNLGLKSFGDKDPDLGRYSQKPLGLLKGAFKTPTLRDVEYTAPYFHDGSAPDLLAVMKHYDRGGDVKHNLSPNMKENLKLSDQDLQDLVEFMKALSSPREPFLLPVLPLD